jgi:S-adenosyl-L-methionine hydrolase (adenosine-forming)
MSIISLTTDFGLKDYWVALIKVAILKELSDAKIIDISHCISPFNKQETAYVLKNSYTHFPKNSVHLIGVDSMAKEDEPHIVVEADNHFFVCADNGILSLILKQIKPTKIIEIDKKLYNQKSNFPTLDIFVPIACHILRGGSIDLLGKKKSEIKIALSNNPLVKENKTILGEVIFVDNYGNAITNIQKELFETINRNRHYEIHFKNHSFTKIVESYYDIVKNKEKEDAYHGDVAILFNSSDHLEIAIYKSNPESVGSAKHLLGLTIGTKIMINFKD